MYFHYRPSGGRGEYEVAGELGGRHATDLHGWTFDLDAGQPGVKPTGLVLTDQGGKPRLRTTLAGGRQIQVQVAAMMLLPESTRDSGSISGGLPVAIEKRYILDRIDFASAVFDEALRSVQVTPGAVTLRSGPGLDVVEDFGARLARVHAVYDRSSELPDAVKLAVDEHRDALYAPGPVGASMLLAVKHVMVALSEESAGALYVERTDPLPALEDLLQISPLPLAPTPTDVAADEPEIRRRETSLLRLQKTRGAGSAKFRRDVMAAYKYRCVVCGLKLPKGTACPVPGVDAAHILPYATYELDVVSNGLCLCKTHHWAFDQQLIVLRSVADGYEIELSDRAIELLADDVVTLAAFTSLVGPVPADRLPIKVSERPKPEFLFRFYDDVPPDD